MTKRYHNAIHFTPSKRRRVEAEFTGAGREKPGSGRQDPLDYVVTQPFVDLAVKGTIPLTLHRCLHVELVPQKFQILELLAKPIKLDSNPVLIGGLEQ